MPRPSLAFVSLPFHSHSCAHICTSHHALVQPARGRESSWGAYEQPLLDVAAGSAQHKLRSRLGAEGEGESPAQPHHYEDADGFTRYDSVDVSSSALEILMKRQSALAFVSTHESIM